MFVDASGDDGYKFKETSSEGSSFSFVVSCFVTTPKELEHNKQVLLNMKHVLFVKPEQEIKSTALRRHRNADAAYSEMSNLKGFAYSLIADKKLIQDAIPDSSKKFRTLTIIAQKELSGVTHTFPYISLCTSNLISDADKILIVIDNMKKREMDSIKSILSNEHMGNYDLIFRDSKDKNFTLIQIADIMAGTIRNYYENCLPLGTHNRYCRVCFSSLVKNKHSPIIFKCKTKERKLYKKYIADTKFNTILAFHQHNDTQTPWGEHIIILPVEQSLYFMYIACLILKCLHI